MPAEVTPLEESVRCTRDDRDVRGIAVKLADGHEWYISALMLSPRGGKLTESMDRLDQLEATLAARQRRVQIATTALETADTDEDVDQAEKRLQGALAARNKASGLAGTCRSDIAYQALRQLYRISREEADELVTEREWEDVLLALNGQDSRANQIEKGIEVLRRVQQEVGGQEDRRAPLPDTSSGAGAGAS